MPDSIHPHSVFFYQRAGPTDGTKGNVLAGGLQIQGIAGFKMQFFAERLWNYNPSRFIDGQAHIHDGIVRWDYPVVYAI